MLRKSKAANQSTGSLARDLPWGLRRAFMQVSRPIDLGAREVLFHAGDSGDGCYLLRHGVVKAAVIARDGQERLLAVLGPGAADRRTGADR